MAHSTSKRVQRIFQNMDEKVDAVVLMNDIEPNLDPMFPYLTGTTSGLFESCLAIGWPDGKVDLITVALEETSARSSAAEVMVFRNKLDKSELVKRALGKARTIGVNGHGLTLNSLNEIKRFLPNVEVLDVYPSLERARAIKDAEEIERLRHACRIASDVAEEIPSFIRSGMAEFEAAAEINYRMQRKGATSPNFDTNASFGANTAEPHHEAGPSKCKKRDMALFDFGARALKYGSDITRTFFVGNAWKWQREMYQVVLEAQLAAIAIIRPGVNGRDVDAVAREIIDASPFKGLFIHTLGHSIGLSVHDGLRMGPGVDLVLEEGMVLTVEPGVYMRGKGGVRIEDDIVVTKKGCEMLTTATRDLIVI